jgi:predicted dehydrogenase
METIKVLLNGLGKVGMLYDLNKSDTVLTHLKALDIHEKYFNVPLQVFVYDVDPSRKFKALEEKSNVIVLKDFENIPDNFFDLTILAVPIGSLSEQILYFDKNNFSKKIVVEKPGCQNIEELNYIKKLQNVDDYLRVGFQRRTLPMSKYIKNLFSNLNTTQLEYSFDIEFGGSFLNIASHFFDLIEYWIPDLTLIELHGNNLSGRLKFIKEYFFVKINYKQTSDTNI